MKKIILLVLSIVLITGILWAIDAKDLHIISSDGRYLGNLGREYLPNSVYNSHGKYGSRNAKYSLRNKNGIYGSSYSPKSPFNFFATELPRIYDKKGNCYGTLSININSPGVTPFSYETTLIIKWVRDESDKLYN